MLGEGKPDAISLPLISNRGLKPPSRNQEDLMVLLGSESPGDASSDLRSAPGFIPGSAGPCGLSPVSSSDLFIFFFYSAALQ